MLKLTKTERDHIKQICSEYSSDMKGDGIKDILKKVKSYLVSVGKVVGPPLLKEVVVPLIVKYAKGKAGLGLKLAGQGKSKSKPPHMVKGSQAAKDRMSELRAMRKK
jgi:hypothetical protein